MKYILTEKKEITHAVRLLRERITTVFSESRKVAFAFPGGGTSSGTEYRAETTRGMLTVMIPIERQWNRRIPHLLNLNPSEGLHAPDVELNIPLSLDRAVSACCVQDGKDVLVCSRGKFTVFKGAIPKPQSMKFFRKWLITVADGVRQTELIPVTALSSPVLAEQLAGFVSEVKILKAQFKDGSLEKELRQPKGWRDMDEFQGRIKKAPPVENSEYEYLHGPIYQALKHYLKEMFNGSSYLVRSNESIDLAVVQEDKAEAIFEIKTSLSFSDQLYKGIGQLLCYRTEFGSSKCKLFIVLPCSSSDTSSLKLLQKVLPRVGIGLVLWKRGKFVGAIKQELRALLK